MLVLCFNVCLGESVVSAKDSTAEEVQKDEVDNGKTSKARERKRNRDKRTRDLLEDSPIEGFRVTVEVMTKDKKGANPSKTSRKTKEKEPVHKKRTIKSRSTRPRQGVMAFHSHFHHFVSSFLIPQNTCSLIVCPLLFILSQEPTWSLLTS